MLVEIKPSIHMLSTLDWERRLFDELIPLPDGTSYNAYVIKGTDRIALIDSSDIRKIEPFLKGESCPCCVNHPERRSGKFKEQHFLSLMKASDDIEEFMDSLPSDTF